MKDPGPSRARMFPAVYYQEKITIKAVPGQVRLKRLKRNTVLFCAERITDIKEILALLEWELFL